MHLTKKARGILAGVAAVALATTLAACASFNLWLSDVKGSLIGNSFNVTISDNYGNRITTFSGSRVDVEAESVDENGVADSSVLRITADGHDITQVGNTVIFAEKGLEPVKDYTLPEEVELEGGSITALDRNVNKLKNELGCKKTIVISSQLGIPLAVYQGNSVGYEVPDDLPKMTKLTVDGKALYIHRANYVIIDTDAIE